MPKVKILETTCREVYDSYDDYFNVHVIGDEIGWEEVSDEECSALKTWADSTKYSNKKYIVLIETDYNQIKPLFSHYLELAKVEVERQKKAQEKFDKEQKRREEKKKKAEKDKERKRKQLEKLKKELGEES